VNKRRYNFTNLLFHYRYLQSLFTLYVFVTELKKGTPASATVPLLLLHRVPGTVCPMLSVTVLCLRTLLRNCLRLTWWTVCRPRRLWLAPYKI